MFSADTLHHRILRSPRSRWRRQSRIALRFVGCALTLGQRQLFVPGSDSPLNVTNPRGSAGRRVEPCWGHRRTGLEGALDASYGRP